MPVKRAYVFSVELSKRGVDSIAVAPSIGVEHCIVDDVS